MEENGGLQWFTGKKKTQPLQSRLKWTAMVGGVWLAPKENEPAVVRKRKRWTDGVEQMKAQLGDRPLERLKEVVRQQWGAGTRYMVLERSEEQREDIERWLDAKSDYDWNGLGKKSSGRSERNRARSRAKGRYGAWSCRCRRRRDSLSSAR